MEQADYLDGSRPAYVLIAGAEPATLSGVANPPSGYAFSETPSPWFVALVEHGTAPAPSPANAYLLAPESEITLLRSEGDDPTMASLSQPVSVGSGGLRGSQDRTEVKVPGAGDIELDEVVYTEGNTVWMTMAGCTMACFNANAAVLGQVISSVKVGAAAL